MEFVLFVEEMGFDPMETMVPGAIRSAEVCGVADWTGSITMGKHADFIVLAENPVKNIHILGHVERGYKDGVLASLPSVDHARILQIFK